MGLLRLTCAKLQSPKDTPITVAGVVIVGVAVAVDIAEVVGVAAIRRTLPPVVRRTIATKQDLTQYQKLTPADFYICRYQLSSPWK